MVQGIGLEAAFVCNFLRRHSKYLHCQCGSIEAELDPIAFLYLLYPGKFMRSNCVEYLVVHNKQYLGCDSVQYLWLASSSFAKIPNAM